MSSSDAVTLTAEQRHTLAAAAERILPRDEWPGASDANVVACMEWLLAQPCYADRRPVVARGLELLDSLAHAMFGRRFADAAGDEQDAVIARLQDIPHQMPRRFFTTLVRMTIAGYFCDPHYGGNRGGIVWRLLGRDTASRLDAQGVFLPPWPTLSTTR